MNITLCKLTELEQTLLIWRLTKFHSGSTFGGLSGRAFGCHRIGADKLTALKGGLQLIYSAGQWQVTSHFRRWETSRTFGKVIFATVGSLWIEPPLPWCNIFATLAKLKPLQNASQIRFLTRFTAPDAEKLNSRRWQVWKLTRRGQRGRLCTLL